MKKLMLPLLLAACLLLSGCAAPPAASVPLPSASPAEGAASPEAKAGQTADMSPLDAALLACDGYAFPQQDGVKYWLETGEGLLKLHCWFLSGDPEYYEKVYAADLKTAEYKDGIMRVKQLTDEHGFALRAVKELRFAFEKDAVTMTADVDESRLAGGAADNLLPGDYRFVPWDGPHTAPNKLQATEPFGELILPFNGYASLSNGVIRCWLDTANGLKLHAWFVSEVPEYREVVYTLAPASASRHDDWITGQALTDQEGHAMPGLRAVSFLFREGSVLMNLTRETGSAAEGDPLPGGHYLFTPYMGSYVPPILDGKQPELPRYDGYACVKDGQTLFWMESSGAMLNLALHCYFPAEGGAVREEVWHIDSERTYFIGNELVLQDLLDYYGDSVFDGYSAFSFRFGENMAVMHVERETPPKEGECAIADGDYLFLPTAAASADPIPEDLAQAARDYYERHNGYRPPEAEVEALGDGLWLIHLYERVESDGVSHTATAAWYTVDSQGLGTDFFGSPVDLSR